MRIEVMGTGCPRCLSLESIVKQAIGELGITADVVKVTDINTIVSKGIIRTPAMTIEGKVVLEGKVPTIEEVKKIIQNEVK